MADMLTRAGIMMSGRFDGQGKEKLIRGVAHNLAARGVNVKIVEAGAGERFGNQTMRALAESKAMVAFCYENYGEKTASSYSTFAEVKYCIDNQAHISVIPVKLYRGRWPPTPCADSAYQNPFLFNSDLVYVDCSDHPFDVEKVADKLYERVAALATAAPDVAGPVPPRSDVARGGAPTMLAGESEDWGSALLLPGGMDSPELVKVLVARKADVNARDTRAAVPLHHAAEKGNPEVVKVLLTLKADVNARDCCGHRPLHLAAEKSHQEVVTILATSKDHFNLGQLCTASSGEDLEAVKDWVGKGVSVNGVYDLGFTPLIYAAMNGRLETVKWLLEQEADVTIATNDNRLPLHFACRNGHTEIAKILIEAKSPTDTKDVLGRTPLATAIDKKQTETAEALQALGLLA